MTSNSPSWRLSPTWRSRMLETTMRSVHSLLRSLKTFQHHFNLFILTFYCGQFTKRVRFISLFQFHPLRQCLTLFCDKCSPQYIMKPNRERALEIFVCFIQERNVPNWVLPWSQTEAQPAINRFSIWEHGGFQFSKWSRRPWEVVHSLLSSLRNIQNLTD